jgi:two-component system chemotaxis sensor kinase CheA
VATDGGGDVAEVVGEFLAETRENLDQFELVLLELESDPTAEKPLATLFRAIHTIKGSCSFLGYSRLERLAHVGESLLARVRDGRIRIDPTLASTLLAMVDVIRRMLVGIEATGVEADVDTSGVIASLERAMDASGHAMSDEVPAAGIARADELRAMQGSDNKIRVDVALLERLMNLVGELVLARNQILQNGMLASSGTGGAGQRLSQVTTEIQEAVMKTRMQPIGHVWSRFPRLVRDLARSTSKLVRLQLEGKETELDKTLIEAIQDPLTHVVRNAVDHGIEKPADRAARGKPREGVITLRAFHEGGMVNVEVSDDGRGLDIDAIRSKALARRLIGVDQAARMSERELLGLVFIPGFSTNEEVTHISGRGVGMDVLKTNVEKIGGSVDLQTRPGAGTTVRLKIPLTLAIIPALIVTSGRDQYAIAQAALLEVVRLSREDQKREIESIQGTPVLRLRGKLLPLTYLARELGTGAADDGESVAIVVLQADDRSFGLVVDDINDTEEIVVKPLWKRLHAISCFAGATVLGDGRVALILDAIGLAQRAGMLAQARAAKHREIKDPTVSTRKAGDLVLLCRTGRDGRLGIPLSKVARLEEIRTTQIERTGRLEVTQYRDRILPLVRVARMLEERRSRPRGEPAVSTDGESLQVVVYSHDDRAIGLVVDGILDVVETEVALQRTGARTGVLGSMVIDERVTEFLDLDVALRIADDGADHARGLQR